MSDKENGSSVSDAEWQDWLQRNRKPRDLLAADYEVQEQSVLQRAKVEERTPLDVAEMWQQFLITLATNGGVVLRACKAHSVSIISYKRKCDEDPEWSTQANRAIDMGTEILEEEVHRRAIDGVLEPIFYQGEVVGHIRKYSDTLLMFMLKARRPQKYKDVTRSELTGPDGGPISTNNSVLLNVMDLLREAADIRAEKHAPKTLSGTATEVLDKKS